MRKHRIDCMQLRVARMRCGYTIATVTYVIRTYFKNIMLCITHVLHIRYGNFFLIPTVGPVSPRNALRHAIIRTSGVR